MAKEWIDSLANEIRSKNREAAEEFGRKQHYAEIGLLRGKEFFVALSACLKENVDALRMRLQGESVSADTTVQNIRPNELKITRARFPWVDARLVHEDETITLDFAKQAGLNGDPHMDRRTCAFSIRVDPEEKLYVEETFVGPPRRYDTPEDLARDITELLFSPEPVGARTEAQTLV